MEVGEDRTMDIGEQNLSDINSWARRCRDFHPECASKASYLPFRPPARLIEIQDRSGQQPFLRLVSTTSLLPHIQYITLSHCWGQTRMAVLRDETEAIFQEEIPWSSLTKTFRDAVRYTARLGVQYIWIDAFCINQDKQKHMDWLNEAFSMASIFSHAFLNLAATSSADGDGGLFLADNPYLASACVVEARWLGSPSTKYALTDDMMWHRSINDAVLNHRAWVLQERLLSPRVVHFAGEQISWECDQERGNESWPTGIPYQDFEIKAAAAEAFKKMTVLGNDLFDINACWLTMVSSYSECHLTDDSDKLIAIAGLAQCTQVLMHCQPTDYIAGLWRPFLLQDLLWHLNDSGERYKTYHAPSWSWASVKGGVVWNPSGARGPTANDFACELKSVQVRLSNEDKYIGHVSSGCVVLAVPLYYVELGSAELSSDPNLKYVVINGRRFVDNETLGEILDDDRIYEQLSEWSNTHSAFFCRFATAESGFDESIWTSDGLLLERTPQDESGTFRRLGWMRLFHSENESEFDTICSSDSDLASHGCLKIEGCAKYLVKIV